MADGKSPRPDGFTIDFFHYYLDFIKNDVLEVVENYRQMQGVLKVFNSTFCTLIPKEGEVKGPNKFQPISLCNIIFKIITKIIANQLKPLLPSLISSKQLGYVEGYKILDNIFLAHEVIHCLNSTKHLGMIMKLDLSKAF
jgi:hypothetical protein